MGLWHQFNAILERMHVISWPEKMLTNTEHPQAIKGLKIGGRTSGKQDPIGG